MSSRTEERTKPYYDIIAAALQARGQKSDDFNQHAQYRQPNYVVRMCESLHEKIGRPDVSLETVLAKEQYASGHVDFHVKLALYCWELASHPVLSDKANSSRTMRP